MLKFFYRPPEFFPRGKFLLKITIFGDFWCRTASFKATTLKFRTTVRSWGSLPQAKFCKNRLREYTPLGKMYTTNQNFFNDFWAVSPHLLSQNGKIWRDGANLGDPPPCQIFEKSLFGGRFIPKITDSAGSKPSSMRFQRNSLRFARRHTTIQDFPYFHGLFINWHIQDSNV